MILKILIFWADSENHLPSFLSILWRNETIWQVQIFSWSEASRRRVWHQGWAGRVQGVERGSLSGWRRHRLGPPLQKWEQSCQVIPAGFHPREAECQRRATRRLQKYIARVSIRERSQRQLTGVYLQLSGKSKECVMRPYSFCPNIGFKMHKRGGTIKSLILFRAILFKLYRVCNLDGCGCIRQERVDCVACRCSHTINGKIPDLSRISLFTPDLPTYVS